MYIETQASAPDEEHAEFDPASLREHEEFTKVKNINRIEIGKYDVETWCVYSSQPGDCPPSAGDVLRKVAKVAEMLVERRRATWD